MENKKIWRVYRHVTPNGMIYVGVTSQDLKLRWQPSQYKGISLEPYIKKYGWNNIQHEVIYTCYDRKEAYEVEGMMIDYWSEKGCCINERRSGLIQVSDRKVYNKTYNEVHRDEISENKKKYYENNKDYILEYKKSYHEAHREEIKIKSKKKRSTPEGKVYDRVHAFNQHHPDRITITPLEARTNYINYNIVPYFIKHDDIPNATIQMVPNNQVPLF